MNRLTRIVLSAGLAGIGLLAAASPASANLATIGSALNLPYDGGVCNNNCLSVQQSQVGGNAPNPLLSPANGIVASWKVRTGDPNTLYSLWVMQPGANNTYTGLAKVDANSLSPPGLAIGTDTVLTFPGNSIPIQQGNAIGVLQTPATNGLVQNTTNGVASNVIANDFNGNLMTVGATRSFLPDQQHELLLQATIAFCSVPNVHKLKKVAAKQALAASDCGVRVKKKETKKKKFRGKVLKQKKAAGTTAAPGTVVPIVIGKKVT